MVAKHQTKLRARPSTPTLPNTFHRKEGEDGGDNEEEWGKRWKKRMRKKEIEAFCLKPQSKKETRLRTFHF